MVSSQDLGGLPLRNQWGDDDPSGRFPWFPSTFGPRQGCLSVCLSLWVCGFAWYFKFMANWGSGEWDDRVSLKLSHDHVRSLWSSRSLRFLQFCNTKIYHISSYIIIYHHISSYIIIYHHIYPSYIGDIPHDLPNLMAWEGRLSEEKIRKTDPKKPAALRLPTITGSASGGNLARGESHSRRPCGSCGKWLRSASPQKWRNQKLRQQQALTSI